MSPMADKPLSDEDVYDLIHEAKALLLNKVVRTEKAWSVLTTAIQDLDLLQRALLIMTDPPQTEFEPSPPSP